MGLTFSASKARQRLTNAENGFKRVTLQTARKVAEDGARVMAAMVPRDTGSLEESIEGAVEKTKDGLIMRIGVREGAVKSKTQRPVDKYALAMNKSGYKLGIRSIEKQSASQFKIGSGYIGRSREWLRRHWMDKLRNDLSKAGLKGRWR